VTCPGCIPRDRVNTNCEWSGDSSFAFDASNAGHRQHLVEDAQLAEELGIRYADAEFARRGGGVEHHGGLLDDGQVRNDCLAKMFRKVEDGHGVSAGDVQAARGRRTAVYDAAVVLMFLPFYALGAARACRWVHRRFSSNERAARWIATGLVSLAVAVLGVQCFRLWGGIWEVIRVGNGHMTSIRAASSTGWVHQYPGADFLGAVAVFWMVALILTRTTIDAEVAPESGAVGSVLLR
jgi:hypothetical protein